MTACTVGIRVQAEVGRCLWKVRRTLVALQEVTWSVGSTQGAAVQQEVRVWLPQAWFPLACVPRRGRLTCHHCCRHSRSPQWWVCGRLLSEANILVRSATEGCSVCVCVCVCGLWSACVVFVCVCCFRASSERPANALQSNVSDLRPCDVARETFGPESNPSL